MAVETDTSTLVPIPVSRSSLALAFVLLLLSTIIFRAQLKARKQSSLGARATPLGYRTSFGILKALRTDTILEWHQKVLDVPGRTVEVNLIGTSMVLTDNIDNIRAIMSTQFDCFGKGETYHKIWSSLMRDSILTSKTLFLHLSNADD
jgi:hypothetical protein